MDGHMPWDALSEAHLVLGPKKLFWVSNRSSLSQAGERVVVMTRDSGQRPAALAPSGPRALTVNVVLGGHFEAIPAPALAPPPASGRAAPALQWRSSPAIRPPGRPE